MSRNIRATGVAVAALSVALGAVYAGPTRAEEAQAVPITAYYTDHETVAPATSDLAVNPIELIDPSTEATPAPVAEHALASVEEVVSGLNDPAEQPLANRSLAQLVNDYYSSDTADSEHECLANAVYFESKGEPLAGQLTVAEVIINRAKSGRFPSTLCGVVKQRGQFSFVHGGHLPAVPRNSAFWRTAVAISHIALAELAEGKAPKALFFHARRVSPGWRLTRVAAVGNHVFYR
jgi:hypothetical protein